MSNQQNQSFSTNTAKAGLNTSVVPEQYHEMLSTTIEWVRQILLEGQEVTTAYFVGSVSNNAVIVVPFGDGSPENVEKTTFYARKVADQMNADCAISVTRLYALVGSPERVEKMRRKYGRISACPGRQMLVSVGLETPDAWYVANIPCVPKYPSKKKHTMGPIVWQECLAADSHVPSVLSQPTMH
jgi:hypothetical protein